MIYREATYADHLAIATLHAESWRHTYRGSFRDAFLDGPVFEDRKAVWQKHLAQPPANQFIVVAEEQADLVGFACAYGRDDPQWGTLLDNLHVRPAQQRQGIGTALVAEVVAWCRAYYADCGLWLWVIGQNQRARRFYERLGALDSGTQLFAPPGGGERFVVHRYIWATLDGVRVGIRGSTDFIRFSHDGG